MPESRRLPRFLLTAAFLYLGWYFLHQWMITSQVLFDSLLCQHIAAASAGVLRVLGFTAEARHTLVVLQQQPSVIVGWQCDGLSLMALFAGFIIAYPGPWRTKLWFIPLGVLSIHLINILRVVGLALNHYYSHATLEFNHHYTFALIVYAFIFWLWTVWVRRYAGRLLNGPAAPEPAPLAPDSSPANAA